MKKKVEEINISSHFWYMHSCGISADRDLLASGKDNAPPNTKFCTYMYTHSL